MKVHIGLQPDKGFFKWKKSISRGCAETECKANEQWCLRISAEITFVCFFPAALVVRFLTRRFIWEYDPTLGELCFIASNCRRMLRDRKITNGTWSSSSKRGGGFNTQWQTTGHAYRRSAPMGGEERMGPEALVTLPLKAHPHCCQDNWATASSPEILKQLNIMFPCEHFCLF